MGEHGEVVDEAVDEEDAKRANWKSLARNSQKLNFSEFSKFSKPGAMLMSSLFSESLDWFVRCFLEFEYSVGEYR